MLITLLTQSQRAYCRSSHLPQTLRLKRRRQSLKRQQHQRVFLKGVVGLAAALVLVLEASTYQQALPQPFESTLLLLEGITPYLSQETD